MKKNIGRMPEKSFIHRNKQGKITRSEIIHNIRILLNCKKRPKFTHNKGNGICPVQKRAEEKLQLIEEIQQ